MPSEWSLIGKDGQRKYLVNSEYEAFLASANRLPPRERAFCVTAAAIGGRISEVLALTKRDIDRAAGSIIIRSLKKRGKIAHREVPVSPDVIAMLDLVFDLSRGKSEQRLWMVDVRNARRWVMKAMDGAKLTGHGPHSLRHTFGARAVEKGVPITALQTMLGHADLKTTSIYAQLIGSDLRRVVERMWT
jgi:integrase